MSRRALLGLALLMVGALLASRSAWVRSWLRVPLEAVGAIDTREESPWYRETLARFERQNRSLSAPCVVLLGDSLVEGLPPELVGARPWVLRGISGDRVRHLVDRVEVSVSATPCGEVLLLAGTNDLVHDAASPQRVAESLLELAEGIAAQGRRVLVSTLPPTGRPHLEARAGIDAVNAEIRRRVTGRLALVDSHAALVDEQGGLRAAFTPDGIHLTRAGYVAWLGHLDPILVGRPAPSVAGGAAR